MLLSRLAGFIMASMLLDANPMHLDPSDEFYALRQWLKLRQQLG